MIEKKKHIHKLKRLKYKSGNQIFHCVLPDCSFKSAIALTLGKRSLCWRCGEEFLMNEYSLRLAKPHCDACHKPKQTKEEGTELDIGESSVEHVELSLEDKIRQTIQQAQNHEQEEEL